ncbi:hypothetical protein C8Q75DRAFT_580118 [Abortiporus biennis]|nr:hypothetical protein C8Q75DRAFT_580118 [Abortiporus biennis]
MRSSQETLSHSYPISLQPSNNWMLLVGNGTILIQILTLISVLNICTLSNQVKGQDPVALLCVFPTLKKLFISMDSYLSYDSRQSHIESQMQLANTEPEFWEVIQGRWSGLHLEANSNTLYDFGLSQNIEQLHVPDCSLKHVTFVHRIVQDLEPKVLRIELTNLNKLFTEHLAYTSGIFQYERLTSLSLSLVLYALEVNETENIAETEAEHAIDTMIEILRTTSLKYLHLDLRWFHPNTSEWLPLVPSNRSLSDAELDEDYLQHLPQSTPDYIRQLLEPKQDNMMEKIIGVIPSLEYLSVVLRNKYPCTWKSTKSWKIVTIDRAGMRRVKRARYLIRWSLRTPSIDTLA